MNTTDYKAAAERTDADERGLVPAFKRTPSPNKAQHSPLPQYDIKHVDFRNLLMVVMGTVSNQTGESFDKAMLRSTSADEIWRRHNALKAHADKLAEALRDLLDVVERIGPPPITKGGLCEEQDWSTGTGKAKLRLQAYEAAQ